MRSKLNAQIKRNTEAHLAQQNRTGRNAPFKEQIRCKRALLKKLKPVSAKTTLFKKLELARAAVFTFSLERNNKRTLTDLLGQVSVAQALKPLSFSHVRQPYTGPRKRCSR